MKILAGYEVRRPPSKNDKGSQGGTPVYFDLHHLAAFGMTQKAGKTTLLEALIVRSQLRALAFKTKRGESGFHNFHEIPPYFKARSDWQWLEGLVNVALSEKVKFEPGMRTAIMRVAEGTKGEFPLILAKVSRLERDARRGFERDVYHKLGAYLRGVVEGMSKFQFSDTFSLDQGINIMDLSHMEEYPEIQQIVIAASLSYIHENLDNVIGVVPEAWEQLPQGRMTPVKWAAERFIRKGASIGNYLWVDSQDIGGIDKTPLRQVDNWFFGRMKEFHEGERITKQLLGIKVTTAEIGTLQLGHFIAVVGNKVYRIYALPANVPPNVGILVAQGRMSPEEVKERFLARPAPPARPAAERPKSEADMLRDLTKRVEAMETNRSAPLTVTTPSSTGNISEANRLRKLIETQNPMTPEKTGETVIAETGNPTPSTESPDPEPKILEVKDPIAIMLVKDPKEKIVAETKSLIGQIGSAILEGTISPGKKLRVGNISEVLASQFDGKWGEGEVMQALRTLTAPPYRLFIREVDPQRRNFFILRDNIHGRVVNE